MSSRRNLLADLVLCKRSIARTHIDLAKFLTSWRSRNSQLVLVLDHNKPYALSESGLLLCLQSVLIGCFVGKFGKVVLAYRKPTRDV